MLMTVFDSFGYCRIGSTIAARRPISRISRLTTTDSTRRLMKISVQDIESLEVAVTQRLRRDRLRRIGRDRHARTGVQLELSERNDAVDGLQASQDLGATLHAVTCL